MEKENTPAPFWVRWFRVWTNAETIRQHEDKILLVLTLIIGAIVGLVVVAFILLTENLASQMYPAGGSAWRRLLVPILGSLIAGVMLQRYFPQARGSGIPQTKAALFIHDGYISLRTTVGKFICSSISLASGIALGREGPSVHVGAGISSVLGRRLGLNPNKVKALFPVGAAAALAAAFNTPIAAVLFALEEVMGDMNARVLGSIVLGSATSWIVMRTILGNEPLFHVPAYELVHPGEILNYAVLGVLGGFISVLFVKLLLYLRKYFMSFPKWCGWFLPAVGGTLVGVLGWFVPEVLGVGYGHVSRALNGQLTLGIMLLLVVLKVVATATCYASGNAGGIFGPSLFIGAMLGGAVGSVAHSFFPDYTGSVGVYALVGMGTAFAGIIRVPLTSVIMIFEVTRDYSIIVPLMISNLLSYFISYRFQREPIYEALQHQDGIHIPSYVRQREGLLIARHAMHPARTILNASDKAISALPLLNREDLPALPVIGQRGLLGMISLDQLEQAVQTGQGEMLLGDLLALLDSDSPLTAENFPHVHDDHPLDVVMRRMAETGLKILPIVSRSNLRELKGTVSLKDIMDAYGLGGQSRQPVETIHEPSTSPVPLLAGISAALLGLFLLTGFFIYSYHSERRTQAEKAFKSGNELLAKGRDEEAVEQFRNALSVSHSREHRTALAMTLLKLKRPNEAEDYLRELLQEDPNSGIANLGLARMAAQQNKNQEAVVYYHRSIYGHWPSHSAENPTEVRFELVEFLRKSGNEKQAITELLALAEQTHDNDRLEKRIGRLLFDVGATKESAMQFRDVLRENKQDAEAYAGLGEAEFALQNYKTAEEAFRNALKKNPDDRTFQNRLDVCAQIVALDPTSRGLNSAERFQRSRSILERTVQALDSCFLKSENVPSDSAQKLLESAKKALIAKARPRTYGEDTEANLIIVENLWKQCEDQCRTSFEEDEVLSRVVERLSLKTVP